MSEEKRKTRLLDWRAIDWRALAVCALIVAVVLCLLPTTHQIAHAQTALFASGQENFWVYQIGIKTIFAGFGQWIVRNRDYIDALSTAAVGFFTALLFVFTALLYRIGKRQQESERRLERAYVFFEDIKFNKDSSSFGVAFKNYGNTPAAVSSYRLACEPHQQPPNPSDALQREMPVGAFIGQRERWRRGRLEIPTQMSEKRREGQSLYLYGEIIYRDIFKEVHRSWFCRRYTGSQFVLAELADPKLNGYN